MRRFLALVVGVALASAVGVGVGDDVDAVRGGLVRAVRGDAAQVRAVPDLPAPFSARRVAWPGPGEVAVTFDDGPCSYTPRVVDLMGDRVATFYAVGVNIQRDPVSLRYAAERGHSIQNHSMRHRDQIRLTNDQIVESLAATTALIEPIAGVRPGSFRPPYGSTNSRVAATVNGAGYSQALWNGGPSAMNADAASIRSSVIGQVQGAAHRDEGLVILFHDCSGRPGQLLAALPDVLDAIDRSGLEYVALG